ncbi:MAG: selenocysteine-specific translation elongation factor [Chloroflexi bacterium]|nr:selenocysteine-specific translation elongation factor [Chloroflexota bacterium]
MFTIGTAGHVDHGKSTLIKALTGIDPDRLREEKERGMTIDLGFAWLRLPNGSEISIVDVPGHERFIKNMLAGVGGIDLALLVIAADEGVMPQTKEHLDILDLLQVKRGLVAVTKKELVDEEWLEMVASDIEDHLKGTVLAKAPIISVSAMTGEGIPELVETLEKMLADTPPKSDVGRPRLPIDRVFTLSGFGTVVTGTLVDGTLQAGQEVEIQPAGLKSRIRGLQTHKLKVEVATPGSRVAVNLASLATTDLQRGDVVTSPRWLVPTQRLDAHLRVVRAFPKPLQHGARVSFHSGSAEANAVVGVLGVDVIEPGHDAWVQIRLDQPVAVVKGDFFVIRTPNATVGGGQIIDPHPKRHKRFQTGIVENLEILRRGSPEEVVLQAVDGKQPVDLNSVVHVTGLAADRVKDILASLVSSGQALRLNEHYLSQAAWARLSGQALDLLRAYHRQHPLRPGMAREEVKSKLALPTKLFGEVIQRLIQERRIAEQNTTLRLFEHEVRFTPDQELKIKLLNEALGENPYSPPSSSELAQRLGFDANLLAALLEQGMLVKLDDSIILLPAAYREMVDRIVAHLQAKGSVTVAEVRDMFGSSRKYVLALLEHLDDQKVTRRVGDERVLR